MLTQNEKVRLARTVAAMRENGGIASAIAVSKLDGVLHSIERELTDGFLTAEVEAKFRDLVTTYPSVTEEYENSPQAQKAKEAARRENPSTADYARMRPEDRLAAINAKEHRDREAAASQAAKLKTDHSPESLRQMNPGSRLELANELGRFEKAVTKKTPTAEQIRKLDAARRLDEINLQIHNSRAENKGALQRLKTALTPKESE